MPSFRYLALNSDKQPVRGELQADSALQAVGRLEAEGLTVQSIGDASIELPSNAAVAVTGQPSSDLSSERVVLEPHLATVLARGQDILPALRAYAQEIPPSRRRQQLDAVLQVLERGDAGHAVRDLAALPEYWIPLLSAATTARDPSRALHEFLDHSQRAVELRQQWRRTLAYPLLVACLAIVVLTALCLFVVPVFRDIFVEFQLSLPSLTVFVLNLAAWISSGRILIVATLAVVGGMLLVRAVRLLPVSLRHWFDDGWGTLLGRANANAQLAQFTADLLEAGLSVPSALRIAGYSTRSGRLQRGAWRLASQIESGNPFQTPLRQPLTHSFIHAVQAAMPAPARIRLLREISRCHSQRALSAASWTHGMLETLSVCSIGAVVGVMVIAMFSPLIHLIHALSG